MRSKSVIAKVGLASASALTRAVIATACTAFAFILSTPSHARDIGALGGAGGTEFRQNCRPGDVLTGFSIKSGKALDSFDALCWPLNPERTGWSQTPGAGYWLGKLGGSGGELESLSCGPNYALRHLHVYVDGFDIVNHIRVTCQALNSGDSYNVVPPKIGGVAVKDARFSCGEGEWATGVYGRYGALIDQLGLQCEKLVVETPPSQAEPPILGGAAPGGKVITKIPGDVTADPTPAAPPPPPVTPTCTIKKDSDIYAAPGGAKIGFLAANTPGVTLLGRQGTDWFNLKWPAGQGWGFSGPGYPDAIACP